MMLTVLTPASSSRLTTVENVRLDLGLPDGGLSAAAIARLIDQASAAIAQFCQRSFGVEALRETPHVPARGDRLVLSRDPLIEVTKVTRLGEVISASDYEVDGGVLRLLRGSWWNACRGTGLSVEYRAGFTLPGDAVTSGPALPADVERAAIMMVGTMLSMRGRDPLLKSENVQGVGSSSYATPAASTPPGGLVNSEAQAILWPYVQPVLA